MKRLKPTAKWESLSNAVFEHPTGARIHIFGLLVISKQLLRPTTSEQITFEAHQPTRKRWLMIWAESKLNTNTEQ